MPDNSEAIAALLAPPPENGHPWPFGDFIKPLLDRPGIQHIDDISEAVDEYIQSLDDETRMECEEGIGCELATYSAESVARSLVYECGLLSVW